MPVKDGDILAGKYRVEKVLGEGAMGVVVSAMHVHLGERVALKFLKPELSQNQEVVARFLREAQAAVRIKGEHIARVSDVGTLESGAPYMVMEYLTGTDLGVLLEKRGKLDVAQAVDCVLQACDAIAEAHSLGIVHRDLKPSNLFLTTRPDGSALVKVLDFGVAKLLNSDPSNPPLTANGAVIGSPLYMSPEQLLGKKTIDARSDVWQLGVILYELITGVCPFDGNTMAEIMLAIGVQPAKPLRQVRPDAPVEIEALIARCLEKDAAQRLPDVAALAEGLLPFATTRRAQVSVEHIVSLIRGQAAVANLPPMRERLPSGAGLSALGLADPGRVSGHPKDASNPYARTMASAGENERSAQTGPPAARAERMAITGPPGPPDRMAQTTPGLQQRSPASPLPWVVAGTLIVVGIMLAFFGIASSKAHDTPPKPAATATVPAPAPAPAPAKTK